MTGLTNDRIAALQADMHQKRTAWERADRAEAVAFEEWVQAEKAYHEACDLKGLLTRCVELEAARC